MKANVLVSSGIKAAGYVYPNIDDTDNYDRAAQIGSGQAGLAPFAGEGHWNDPYMLGVGNGGMTLNECQTHMSLWAILAAPLLAGNDPATMTRETTALLTNRELIAIDQDSLGMQGDRASAEGPIEIWVRPPGDGSKAIGVFNRHYHTAMKIDVDFRKLGIAEAVSVRNIWQANDMDP